MIKTAVLVRAGLLVPFIAILSPDISIALAHPSIRSGLIPFDIPTPGSMVQRLRDTGHQGSSCFGETERGLLEKEPDAARAVNVTGTPNCPPDCRARCGRLHFFRLRLRWKLAPYSDDAH
jgi:hypothetical protein